MPHGGSPAFWRFVVLADSQVDSQRGGQEVVEGVRSLLLHGRRHMRITERKPFLGLGCTVAPKNLGCRRAAIATTTLHLTGCASAQVRPRLRHSGKRGIRHRARARPADQLPHGVAITRRG
jgi:hypothetical protein